MASYESEVAFVGRFARLAADNHPAAWKAIERIRSEMIEAQELATRYALLASRFARGDELQDPDDQQDDVWLRIWDEAAVPAPIDELAERILGNWQAREQLRLLQLGVIEADKAIAAGNGKARRIADRLSMALLELFSAGGNHGRPQNLQEIIDAELDAMESGEDPGIAIPYPKLDHACGPWLPGDVIGMTAYSGSGKSVWAANLAARWTRRGVPVIAFPTEMGERWVARAVAAETYGAQRVRQWVVEKRQWSRATPEERELYAEMITEYRTRPLEVVNRPNITPAQITAAVRVLRKRWSGRTVVVVVDHMHRLDYEGEDPNESVGQATKLFKNFAMSDSDGGLVFLLLFQPKKPHGGDVYKPIAGYEIRGDSMVWNELDVHLSPFRAWVKCDVDGRPLTGENGAPRMAKPNTEGAILSEQHAFLKVDKRRIGGEGPTIWMPYDSATGAIYDPQTFPVER